MATCPFPLSTSTNHHHHHHHHHLTLHAPPLIYNCAATKNTKRIVPRSPTVNIHRSFPLKRNYWSGCCHATSSESEPPSTNQPPPSSGVMEKFTKLQDTLQIFFAVLFWMSLFFWSCAWDGRDDGRPTKGSRFRK